MKGIYLNDIPFELFLKYFSRQSLADRVLRPKMVNYFATVYTYNLTVDSVPIVYKSIYSDINDIGDQLRIDLEDLFPTDYDISDLLAENILVVSTPSAQEESIFVRPKNSMYVYPYEFYYEKIDVQEYYFVQEDGSSNLIDSRNGEIIQSDVSLTDQGNRSLVLSSTGTLLGYLYYNRTFRIQESNELGQLIFLDSIGLDTTRRIDKNNFLYHNRLIRTNWFDIVNKEDLVKGFDPGKVGIINTGLFKKAMFYEKFRITKLYEKISKPVGEYFELTTVTPSYRSITVNGEIETIIEDVDKVAEVLHFSNLKKLKGEYISYVPGTLKVKTDSVPYAVNILDNVLFTTTKRYVLLKNKTYQVDTNNMVDTEEFGLVALENQSLKVVVTENSGIYTMTYKGRTLTSTRIGNNNYFIFDNSDFLLQGTTGNYYIEYPVKISRRDFPDNRNVYIGTVTVKDVDEITITPIQLTASELTIANSFDLNGFTGNSRITYFRDLLDGNYYIKLTETISKVSTFTDPFSKFPTDLEMNDFLQSFASSNHYIVTSNRGDIVREDVYKNMRKEMTSSLTGEFLNKRLDNYLIVNSGLYDTNSLMKMRIFAEGLNNIILNDKYNLRQVINRRYVFQVSDLPKKIIIEKINRNNLRILSIEDNRLYGIAKTYELNAFQRIRDYRLFPTNEARVDYYTKMNKRYTSYSTFDKTDNVVNEIEEFDEALVTNNIPRETFKKKIVDHFINGFFESGIDALKYSNDFEKFYKTKMANLPAVYNDITLNTEYKKVFTLDDIQTERENELIADLLKLTETDNWRVRGNE
jgi:hypothetical protein